MNEARVARKFLIEGSTDRLLLMSWACSLEPRRNNVVRVDRHGNVVWRAELPSGPTADCFNALEREGERFIARTYSGWTVHLDASGRVLESGRTRMAACSEPALRSKLTGRPHAPAQAHEVTSHSAMRPEA